MLDTTSPEHLFSKHSLGKLYGINVFVVLHEKDVKAHIKLKYLPKSIKDRIQKIKAKSQKITLGSFIDNNTDPEYELSHNEYYEQIAFQDSVVFRRSIDTNTYKISLSIFNRRSTGNTKKYLLNINARLLIL